MKTNTYITSRVQGDPEGIWPTTEWIVMSSNPLGDVALFGATWPLARVRCRVWGVVHGYGWLSVVKAPSPE